MNPFAIVNGRRSSGAFTLIELLISMVILTLLILIATQVVNTAATIARPANKHIDTDTQARVVLDRMAVDFAKMLKRTDVDYYIKAPAGYRNPKAHGNGLKLLKSQEGNDQMAFFSEVPGYYPSTNSQSPLSLVAYRINNKTTSSTYLQLERMGKGLLWNGVKNANNDPYPLIFSPGQIKNELDNKAGSNNPWAGPWSAAIYNDNTGKSNDPDGSYETIGPGVFRLEYYYLLKDGTISSAPRVTGAVNWSDSSTLSAKLNAFSDVEAIAVAIAVIDPASRALVYPDALFNLMSDMADFTNANGNGFGNPARKIGDVENSWNLAVQSAAKTGTAGGDPFPPAAASAIRIYSRHFNLRTLAEL